MGKHLRGFCGNIRPDDEKERRDLEATEIAGNKKAEKAIIF